jgi:hypothetical protein
MQNVFIDNNMSMSKVLTKLYYCASYMSNIKACTKNNIHDVTNDLLITKFVSKALNAKSSWIWNWTFISIGVDISLDLL